MCPNGQRLTLMYESQGKTASGYPIRLRHYRSPDCSSCPLREQCTKAVGNREIRMSIAFHWATQKAKAHLLSPEGKELSTCRMTEVPERFYDFISSSANLMTERHVYISEREVNKVWNLLCSQLCWAQSG